jgi:outer membrane protein assembly factor BamB
VQLDDGRLVGGTRGGRIFVYDPATGETWDVGEPVSDTVEIAALALGRDGLVYGGTTAYASRSSDARATLFTFDPVNGLINDVGQALPQARLVGALAVAGDGQVYAGVADTLVVYDPATERVLTLGVMLETEERVCSIRALVVGPRGRFYGGCDDHFFVYDPSSKKLTDLGIPVTEVKWRYGDVIALTVGDDGRIYGSIEFKCQEQTIPNP